MDIQQWLAATTDRAPPLPSDHHHMPGGVWAHPQDQHRQERSRPYRSKTRKPAASDSSLIVPWNVRPANRGLVRAATRSLPSEHPRSVRSADSRSRRSADSSPSPPGSRKATPEKLYERRPRHKTRPDRYEPKARKRKGAAEARGEKQSKKKRRKSHRSADGGRTAGLIQSFQLKNGPKNSRLTIKPGVTAGLFKHGRASAQVTGRGAGLPDLVFNELRFLQRPAEHQDTVGGTEQQREDGKDRRQPNHGEISAYFSAKQSAHMQANEQHAQVNRAKRTGGEYAAVEEAVRPRRSTQPVELPARPFLGFGSRGAVPDSRETLSEDTSMLTWSQTSPREPLPTHRNKATAPRVDSPEAHLRGDASALPSHGHAVRDEVMHGHHNAPLRGPSAHPHQERLEPHERAKGDGAKERHTKRRLPQRASSDHRRSASKTTSQSLPRVLAERSHNEQERHATADNGYRTSDILNVHEYVARSRAPPVSDASASGCAQLQLENQDPRSSFSIDRLLNDVRRIADADTTKVRPGSSSKRHSSRQGVVMETMLAGCIRGQVTAVRGEAPRAYRAAPRTPVETHRHIPRTFSAHQMPSQNLDRRHVEGVSSNTPARYHRADVGTQGLPEHRFPLEDAPADNEILDIGQEVELWGYKYSYASAQQAEDLVHGRGPGVAPGMFEAQSEQPESEGTSLLLPHRRSPGDRVLARSFSVGMTLASEQGEGETGGATVEGMDDFWKPNRLY